MNPILTQRLRAAWPLCHRAEITRLVWPVFVPVTIAWNFY